MLPPTRYCELLPVNQIERVSWSLAGSSTGPLKPDEASDMAEWYTRAGWDSVIHPTSQKRDVGQHCSSSAFKAAQVTPSRLSRSSVARRLSSSARCAAVRGS